MNLWPQKRCLVQFGAVFRHQLCVHFVSCSERKNVNLPGVVVDLPTLTDKDVDDLVNWGVPNEIDVIAASFVRKGADLDLIREVLGERGR